MDLEQKISELERLKREFERFQDEIADKEEINRIFRHYDYKPDDWDNSALRELLLMMNLPAALDLSQGFDEEMARQKPEISELWKKLTKIKRRILDLIEELVNLDLSEKQQVFINELRQEITTDALEKQKEEEARRRYREMYEQAQAQAQDKVSRKEKAVREQRDQETQRRTTMIIISAIVIIAIVTLCCCISMYLL